MIRLRAAAAAVAACAALLAPSCSRPERPERPDGRPNIVLIVADDLGIDGVSAYRAESVKTPRLDRLAAEGLRFENCYATPICTPSRVQLLTGRYPFRSGFVGNLQYRVDSDEIESFLPPEETTFAQLLRGAGYRTAVAGKWQLCLFEERKDHVRELGFDDSSVWLWKGRKSPDEPYRYTSRYWLPCIVRNGETLWDVPRAYGPDLECEFLVDFVREHRTEPFLLYWPMTLPHGPWHPTPHRLDPDDVTSIPTEKQAKDYRDMVAYMDELVGRLVDAIDAEGLGNDTLVLFTGDNGSAPELALGFRGLTRNGGKGTLSEEGTRVPLIARWSGRIARGQTTDDLVDLSDFLPTLAELGRAPLPQDRRLDGTSFVPRLLGTGGPARRWVFSSFFNRAEKRMESFVRLGRFKLYDGREPRVYDVEADPLEKDDRVHDAELREVRGEMRRVLEGLTP